MYKAYTSFYTFKMVSGKKTDQQKRILYISFYLPVKMLLLVMLFAILKIVLPLVCLLCLRYTEKRSIPNKSEKNIEIRKEHQSE